MSLSCILHAKTIASNIFTFSSNKRKKMRKNHILPPSKENMLTNEFCFTVTGFLIANLAVADLGVGMLCIPFTVVYFELDFHWPFGAFMCKLLPALMACFVMGSVGTMLAISLGKEYIQRILLAVTDYYTKSRSQSVIFQF